MKKLFFIPILSIMPLWLMSQNVYTLKQCLETAYKNSLEVKQNALFMETAESNFNQSKNNKLPRVNGNYAFGINNGRSIDPFTNGYINQQLSSSNAGVGVNFTLLNKF